MTGMSSPTPLTRLRNFATFTAGAVGVMDAQIVTKFQISDSRGIINCLGLSNQRANEVLQNTQEYGFWPESVEVQYVCIGSCRTGHTSQMVAFEVINARECTLTDITAEMLLHRLHGGPGGSRGISGVKGET